MRLDIHAVASEYARLTNRVLELEAEVKRQKQLIDALVQMADKVIAERAVKEKFEGECV